MNLIDPGTVGELGDLISELETDPEAFVDRVSFPADDEFPPALEAFFASVARPETRARLLAVMQKDCNSGRT
jgi:hypothetical protein